MTTRGRRQDARPGQPNPMPHPEGDGARAPIAGTILACAGRSGRLWWTEWEGLQWSPTNALTGMAYHGADRLALAAAALALGHDDRRWGTVAQLDELGYRVRKVDLAKGVCVDGTDGEPLYNAGLARRKRSAGGRHDARVPAEERDTSDEARNTLAAIRLVAPDGLSAQGTRGLSHLLRTMALACIPTGALPAHGTEDMAALRSLVADLACAIALSDLGIAPSEARAAQSSTCDEPTERWAHLIEGDPRILTACANAAEITLSVLLNAVLVEGARARRPEARAVVTEAEATAMEPQEGTSRPKGNAPAQMPTEHPHPDGQRLADELGPTASPRTPAGHAREAITARDYTLRDVIAESELASSALARNRQPNRKGANT